MSPRWGSKPRRTDRLVIGRNVTLNFGGSLSVEGKIILKWNLEELDVKMRA
jgi:hypothetical protein